ncbi:hypothetical protein [Dysgonomonas sp. 25]|uniref:hypothetical protein n=1 Tax=Dysgonomonas sp. 25 TaxID=2302933 RepID=UPI0013D639B8|nr:hypothetical protein [Dysgonomonas sp. 25]
MKSFCAALLVLFAALLCSCKTETSKEGSATTADSLSIASIQDTIEFGCGSGRKPFVTGNTKYFIVTNAFFNDVKMKRKNAAVLIMDEEEIVENENLFFENPKRAVYLCGYEYDVIFLDKEKAAIERLLHNTRCHDYCFANDSIRDRMEIYKNRLIEDPTHYIYDLKIMDNYTLEKAITELTDAGFMIFSLSGSSEHKIQFGRT